jgi:hypothetical protein
MGGRVQDEPKSDKYLRGRICRPYGIRPLLNV